MGREDQIINERLRKIEELRKQNINPYPNKFDKKDLIQDCLSAKMQAKVKTAGRLMTKRGLGRIDFAILEDQTGRIQLVFQEGETPEQTRDFLSKYIDSGDFIGVDGKIFKTKTGEKSILVNNLTLVTKSVLPLPDKFHGLKDEEERFRKRYLDLISNSDTKEIFEKRAKILEAMRSFMKKERFVEVETPILQPVYGGAMAKPFKTHIDAYNSEIYLSIAPELPLKKALVGGFDRVFEITKKFRNEGVDRSHNPEHMTIEWYQAYANYEDGMKLFEALIKYVAREVNGSLTLKYQGHTIDLNKWQKMSLFEAIKKYLNEDVATIKTNEEAKKLAKKYDIDPGIITKTNLPDELMKLFRHKLVQPTFLTDYPIESSPLAKPKASDPTKAEIFQPFIGGLELARAYSELNDPQLQEENFNDQIKERAEGNMEAMPLDLDFVEALKHGMPPACGVGIGIERIVMLLTDQASIRDVILFPFMRPQDSPKKKK